ncbi:HEAT repeat domain-containing protein [Paenibacillus whitsoniae]|uniref:HEAT repeat domain-containing protein n=1 Tax=Paenibacillus whitsoniae TaxID=2496558 RepID=A0A3S0BTK3_9BACL|nr:HEAT repeat domain-containing protein [Paenibacillus whitsoniae]RTE08059.1 HEAT repeat domain-containing protein [Paenibacillus whitsoniae]
MYTNLNAAIQALYIILAFNLVCIGIIYAIKLRSIRRRKLNDRFQTKFKDYLTYVQANLDGMEPLRTPPWTMNAVEREAMQERLNDMMDIFSGEQRRKLMQLCLDLGLVHRHLERLSSRSYRVKLDAAYHLGCMRVKEAAPALLDMLKEHGLNSALFVVARAVAKCARGQQDLEAMVQIVLGHNKKCYELIVDMIGESDVDAASLYTGYVSHKNLAYVRIGLTGLTGYTDPAAASAVFRLMDAEQEDIQIQAVGLYLKSSRLLPRNVVSKLLSHPNLDIRRLTIEALADIRNPAYVEAMTASLGDADQRIVYASGKGLLRMGEEGMAALCERAAAAQGTERGQFMQQLIDDELKHLSMQLHNWDKLTQYNTLMYTYDKIFRKAARLYRVV